MSGNAPGPTCHAVLCTDRLEDTVSAWCIHLRQREQVRGKLSAGGARNWNAPRLAGANLVWLGNELGEPWLCVVEDDRAPPVDAFQHSGWLSLEVGARRIDALREKLRDSPFEILGEPAALEVSPNVRAMQVRGPAGEVVYLTEVRAEVPGFELARARCEVDRLFIPVLLAADREEALKTWEMFPALRALRLETRITVINRARGLPPATRHPIAALQLAGGNLIEIDELEGLRERPRAAGGLPAGIAVIGVALPNAAAPPLPGVAYEVADGPFAGRRATLIRGAAGELIEFIEQRADAD